MQEKESNRPTPQRRIDPDQKGKTLPRRGPGRADFKAQKRKFRARRLEVHSRVVGHPLEVEELVPTIA